MTTNPSSPSSLFLSLGSETTDISNEELQKHVASFLDAVGDRDDVLILPPDFTRFHSRSGTVTRMIGEHLGFVTGSDNQDGQADKTAAAGVVPKVEIMPALGTHAPMTPPQIKTMFGPELAAKSPSPFLVHDWRNDVETIGEVPAKMVKDATYGMVDEPWPAQLNKVVWEKRHQPPGKAKPLVVSIGQVVPHEVMGMANFNKNLFVGVGGVEAINLSHFIGAVHGMEKMMGKASNPLRSILNYASEEYLHGNIDLWYILTVIGSDPATGDLKLRGLYIGNSIECYTRACELSLKVNFTMLDRAPTKVVAYLDADEFHSTWLGNKAIYRTRMAIADGGELIVLAPGVQKFGEDDQNDVLIRKYGYRGTPATMKAMEENDELKNNLSVVAHLIHGSSEGRFSVTYCPGHLTKEEIEGAGLQYADLGEMKERYSGLKDGWNKEPDGNGEFYYISNPALGLWAVASKFSE